MGNLPLIVEAVAAFIVHEETRISQKAINAFERIIRWAVTVEPAIISQTSESLRAVFSTGL